MIGTVPTILLKERNASSIVLVSVTRVGVA